MTTKSAPRAIRFSTHEIFLRGLGVFADDKHVSVFFQSADDSPEIFHIAQSTDGFSFTKIAKDLCIKRGTFTKEHIASCQNFSIIPYADHYMLTYQRIEKNHTILEKAWSKDLFNWEHEGPIMPMTKPVALIKIGNNTLLFSADPTVGVYHSKDMIQWEALAKDILPIANSIDASSLVVSCAYETQKGIALVYHGTTDGHTIGGFALFDKENPTKLLWHAQKPIWADPLEWQDERTSSIGVAYFHNEFIGYLNRENIGLFAAIYAIYNTPNGHTTKDISLQLHRPKENPMIAPNSKNHWEAFNTFNPAALYDDDKVHLLYRAQGYDYVSVLGYATSSDGLHIDSRHDDPIYVPTAQFESVDGKKPSHIAHWFVSGGGYGGCEDPRITKIDDRYFLTYVAFDGASPPRVALTSIKADDFLSHRFLWEKPVLISPPNVVDKSAVIFPEKIGGKYVIMHRIYPNILIDFVDSLQFDGTSWLEGKFKISPRPNYWDSRKIGAGAPPIKTKFGWLLIYQSVGEQDAGRYKIGAMLLDLQDPTKVLHRSQSPILEPIASYENDGFKAGVVYPCGAVVIGDTLYVYYGGADSYVCVATARLEPFLQELMYSEVTKPITPIIQKVL